MNVKICRAGIALALVMLPGAIRADIVPDSPVKDQTVVLLPEIQKKIMQFPTHEERLQELNSDRETKKSYFAPGARWRKGQPVTFRWSCTAGECGPFRVEISETPDFADPIYGFSAKETNAVLSRRSTNFKIGQKYYWRVIGRNANKEKVFSAAASFVTEDLPPRWIGLYGTTENVRDLGGYVTADGRRVRQGMLYRGQGLNYNSVDREIPGANRLMIVDQQLLLDRFHIRTDLDLRSLGETAGMKVSPLGSRVNFIQHSSYCYAGIFTADGKKVMAQNFRLFCDEKNYPIYFHCIAGADRTGSLAYVLNGLLGVPEHSLGTDWEHTFYPNLPDNSAGGNPNFWRLYRHFADGFSKYGNENDPLSRKIELYLLDCGIQPEEIAEFRRIMLE